MKITAMFVLSALLLLSSIPTSAQTLAVNSAFDPSTYRPLDGPERWRRWQNEDGGTTAMHLHAFVMASVSQSMNNPSQWKRTTGGFARRMGGAYGGIVVTNSIHEGLAAVEGTDPRYFPCACRGFFRRSGHALEMTFLTYDRNGRKTPDFPQLAGTYGGTMIGTLWWPSHYDPLVHGVQAGDIQMGLIGTLHIVQEFSPELKRFFHVGSRTLTDFP